MKLFDGLYKYTYQTIFGKIELYKCTKNGIRYKLHDEVNISNMRLIVSPILWEMRFDTRVLALKKLIELEKKSIDELRKIL